MSIYIQQDSEHSPKRSSSCPQFATKRKSCPHVGEAALELIAHDRVEFVSLSNAPMNGATPEVVRSVKKLAKAIGVPVVQSYIFVPDYENTSKSLHAYVLSKL